MPEKQLARRSHGLPQKYDPAKGLKSVAVAEAAEIHFRRAKDATRLSEAVELKLAEQRKFVLWWDGQEKHPGSRKGAAVTDQLRPAAGKDGLPDRETLHRWRVRLKDLKKFDKTLAEAQARCLKVCESRQSGYSKSEFTGEVEWYTPSEYIEAAREVLGAIDLDPATSKEAQAIIKAKRFYTKEEDGLTRPWSGRVWLNPPYMQPDIVHFVTKLVEEYTAGRTTAAILLTHNYTDTAWFHLAVGMCSAICFTRGRIAFVDTHGDRAAPTQGQAFFYYGPQREQFQSRFSEIGFLVARL